MPQAACKALAPRPMPSRHMSVPRSDTHGSIRERHCGRRQAPASTAAHVRCNGAFDPAETSDRLAQIYASNRLAQIPCNKGGWLWQGAVPLGMGTVPSQFPPAGMSARGHQPAETSGRFSADPRIQPAHSNSPHRGGPASATGHGVASRRRRHGCLPVIVRPGPPMEVRPGAGPYGLKAGACGPGSRSLGNVGATNPAAL